MLTDAARGGFFPRAPRSFSRSTLATVWLAALSALTSCGGDAATSPDDATYVAALSGANERPPREIAGSGTATIRVSGGVATYVVSVAGLTGPVTLAHILIGDAETAAGLPIARLASSSGSGTIASGTIDLRAPVTFNNTTISGDSLRSLFEHGTAYVNVYTATYPGGEVRGQIVGR